MSFGNAISMKLLFVITSYATGITGTACTYADQAVYSFADKFELSIRSSNAAWYREGMQFFAFQDTGKRWHKRPITWSVLNVANEMSRTNVNEIIATAFAKWAKWSTLTFKRISRKLQPDIRVQFGLMSKRSRGLSITKCPEGNILDNGGVDITFNGAINWTRPSGPGWYNFRYVALFETGRALGLSWSNSSRGVMYRESRGSLAKNDPDLGDDDILGIRVDIIKGDGESQIKISLYKSTTLYGGPRSSGPPLPGPSLPGSSTRMHGYQKPPSSSSGSSSSSSSSNLSNLSGSSSSSSD